MKRTITYIFLIISTLSLYSQNRAVLEANDLMAQKSYLSAYNVLNGSDPNSQSPEIAIAKTNLLMNFNISTNLYQDFTLKDLAPNESIENYESITGIIHNIHFSPDSILTKLSRQYPQNYELLKILGSYYYEVHLKYPNDSWLNSDSVILEKMEKNYLKAYQNKTYDYWSLFGLGYANLLKGKNKQAIDFLKESIQLNPKYALSYYNLGYAYLNLKDNKKALEYGLKAYEMQAIPTYKSQSAKLIGTAYKNMKNKNKAYEYLVDANKLSPNDYNTLISLLDLEIALNKPEYKNRTLDIFLLAPDNPVVIEDIIKAYKKGKKQKELIKFLEDQKPYYRTDVNVLSNLYLYTGISLYETKKWVQAKINLEKARNLFKTIYDEDHNVFKVIDSYTKVIKKK